LGILIVLDDKPFPDEVVQIAKPLLETFAERATAEFRRIRAEEGRETLIAELETQNAELDRFTHAVSHDLKSPLITIKGFSDVLKNDLAAGDARAVEHDLSRIGTAADKMVGLLDELLNLSRIGRLVNPPQNVDLGDLAREVVAIRGDRIQNRGVVVEIAPQMPVVFGDRPRLLEMLRNLIDNAVKYLGTEPHPRLEIGHRLDGIEVVCYVSDNGVGVEPEHHAKIFGLFEQIDPNAGGTGIGLSTVKRIVEVHGGRVWVESEGRGRGASFCFTIPTRGDVTSSHRTGQ
jgi:signal transduction histidine kinase